jgi:hypothetical protein
MSQSLRQSELFVGQDWRILHQAFSEINFNAYDFDTIRAAMRDYIRYNYPEEYNDWIESSEFVSLIDLLAYLGGMLAFRVDINAHENFMDTATSRESILRLARILSYTPRRNYPARGVMKVTKISTDDDIIDSNGTNLNSAKIIWDDAQNQDWFEQWTLVMNAALITTNPFGQPLKIGSVGGIRTQLYRFNSLPEIGNLYSFTRSVDAKNSRFEVVNMDFEDNGTFTERMPDPLASFHTVYRNDGNGNSSPNTGFFFYFKQGELRQRIFQINEPEENRVIDINDDNINEIDVWVQSINDSGFVSNNGVWKKVQTVDNNIFTGDNVTFNPYDFTERNIYSIITRDNDNVSLRFSDGRFGTIPQGLLRVYYRTSNGENYTIRPQDFDSVDIIIPYTNEQRLQKNLTLTLSLQQPITNSVPRESDEDIRRRAPQVYYTQNRMVSGEDYQNFPTQNNLARKIKALNRVYSGHSRYIDLNDPTGTYQNVNIFSDDGLVFNSYDEQYFEMPISNNINRTSTSILNDIIQPFIQSVKMKNFIWDRYLFINEAKPSFTGTSTPWLLWHTPSGTNESNTGEFVKLTNNILPNDDQIGDSSNSFTTISQPIGLTAGTGEPDIAKLITEESLVKFANAGWVSVNAISSNGSGIVNNIGRVRLANSVKLNDYVLQVLPAFRTTLDAAEGTAILDMLNSRKSFGIGYDYKLKKFYIIEPNKLKFKGEYNYVSKNTTEDSSWLITVEYSADTFRICGRGLIYVFESERDCRFYIFNDYKQYNHLTGLVDQDVIKVLDINYHPALMFSQPWKPNVQYTTGTFVKIRNTFYQCVTTHTSGTIFSTYYNTTLIWEPINPSLGENKQFSLVKPYTYRDGYIEPKRIQVSFFDSDANGVPDNPEIFYQIIGNPLTYTKTGSVNNVNTTKTYLNENSPQWLFWEKYKNLDNYEYYRPSQINPVRIRKVFTTYVDINHTNVEQTVSVTINNRQVVGRSTIVPSMSLPDGGLPDGSLVLLTGQNQFENTNARQTENNKVYRYNRSGNNGNGTLEVLSQIPSNTLDILNVNGYKLVNVTANILWDFDTKEFWLYNSIQGKFLRDENGTYDWYLGRSGLKFQWKHLAPRDHRIDPAVTNIIDIFVLTTQYDIDIRNWVRTGRPRSEMPISPSELELKLLFSDLESFKMFSDQLVWRPVKYKMLFGNRADDEFRVRFKVIKMETSVLSDGEIKAQIIRAINEFFAITRWDFGETFYWSDLSTYIHLRMQNIISSVVLVPFNEEASFGNLFEIPCMPDEIFISVATVDDVVIIPTNTQTNLRIR